MTKKKVVDLPQKKYQLKYETLDGDVNTLIGILEDRLLVSTEHLSTIDKSIEIQKTIKKVLKDNGHKKTEHIEMLISAYNSMYYLSNELEDLRGFIKFFKYKQMGYVSVSNEFIHSELNSEIEHLTNGNHLIQH